MTAKHTEKSLNYFVVEEEPETKKFKGKSMSNLCNIINGKGVFMASVFHDEAVLECADLNDALKEQLDKVGLEQPHDEIKDDIVAQIIAEDYLKCPYCLNDEIDDEFADGIQFKCEICGNSFEVEYVVKSLRPVEDK